jgi:hypothetical protein
LVALTLDVYEHVEAGQHGEEFLGPFVVIEAEGRWR